GSRSAQSRLISRRGEIDNLVPVVHGFGVHFQAIVSLSSAPVAIAKKRAGSLRLSSRHVIRREQVDCLVEPLQAFVPLASVPDRDSEVAVIPRQANLVFRDAGKLTNQTFRNRHSFSILLLGLRTRRRFVQ